MVCYHSTLLIYTIKPRDGCAVIPKFVRELAEDVESVLRVTLETEEFVVRLPALEVAAEEHQVYGPDDGVLPAKDKCLEQ